jgi:hypothetical protein
MFLISMRRLFMTRTILPEDEFDRVSVQVLDSSVEAATLIVAITRSSTRPASSLEGVGVAVAYLSPVICSESDVCWRDYRTA